jgi:hypothetical protein
MMSDCFIFIFLLFKIFYFYGVLRCGEVHDVDNYEAEKKVSAL